MDFDSAWVSALFCCLMVLTVFVLASCCFNCTVLILNFWGVGLLFTPRAALFMQRWWNNKNNMPWSFSLKGPKWHIQKMNSSRGRFPQGSDSDGSVLEGQRDPPPPPPPVWRGCKLKFLKAKSRQSVDKAAHHSSPRLKHPEGAPPQRQNRGKKIK